MFQKAPLLAVNRFLGSSLLVPLGEVELLGLVLPSRTLGEVFFYKVGPRRDKYPI